jgi:hypothetical protein
MERLLFQKLCEQSYSHIYINENNKNKLKPMDSGIVGVDTDCAITIVGLQMLG